MNEFLDLFRHPTRSANGVLPWPDTRRDSFPAVVERSHKLHLWAPGQPICTTGRRLLLGVATWSGYDMALLDLLEEAPAQSICIDVFDIDTDPTEAGLRLYIPGVVIGPPTPYAGLWEDGRLIESAGGHAARQLVARVCSLPWEFVQAAMGSVLTSR